MKESYKHFDKVAEDYDALLPAHVQEHYRRKRVRLLAPLLAGGVGLDVGCGTGALMAALRRHGRVTGVDGSARMIEVLRKKGRGEAVQATTDQLPFADSSFDLVFSVAVLHHVADQARVRRTIHEMVRVAKPGGHVVIWDHNPKNPYWPIIMKRVPQDTGEERLIPAEEIEAALRGSGVQEITRTQSGFLPEFAPRVLMPLARLIEAVVERTPLLRRLTAHNVIVAAK